MNHTVFSKLRLVDRLYLNQYTNELLPYGLTVSQWGVLRYLVTNGETTFSDLANTWHLENPTITPIAQKLVEKQYIEIEVGHDRRQKMMKITELGKQKFDEINPIAMQLFSELLDGISEEEQQQFINILTRIYVNITKRG